MAKYKLKPMILEAFSFDELMEYGRTQTDNIYNNMPWSFEFMGYSITHETDELYILGSPNTNQSTWITPEYMLLVQGKELIPMEKLQFEQTCDLVKD